MGFEFYKAQIDAQADALKVKRDAEKSAMQIKMDDRLKSINKEVDMNNAVSNAPTLKHVDRPTLTRPQSLREDITPEYESALGHAEDVEKANLNTVSPERIGAELVGEFADKPMTQKEIEIAAEVRDMKTPTLKTEATLELEKEKAQTFRTAETQELEGETLRDLPRFEEADEREEGEEDSQTLRRAA